MKFNDILHDYECEYEEDNKKCCFFIYENKIWVHTFTKKVVKAPWYYPGILDMYCGRIKLTKTVKNLNQINRNKLQQN